MIRNWIQARRKKRLRDEMQREIEALHYRPDGVYGKQITKYETAIDHALNVGPLAWKNADNSWDIIDHFGLMKKCPYCMLFGCHGLWPYNGELPVNPNPQLPQTAAAYYSVYGDHWS